MEQLIPPGVKFFLGGTLAYRIEEIKYLILGSGRIRSRRSTSEYQYIVSVLLENEKYFIPFL
jgi:hypothetical protein